MQFLDVTQYIDIQYIVGVILLGRFLLNYTAISSWHIVVNHKKWAIYILGTIIAFGFTAYYKMFVPGTNIIAYSWKLLLSYTVATSMYDMAVQKIFEMIERYFGVDKKDVAPANPPQPPVQK